MSNGKLKRIDSELLQASYRGDVDALRSALEKGANPEATNDERAFPLLLASEQGNTECVKALLEAGSRINRRSTKSDSWPGICGTALNVASCRNKAEVVRLLLASGADVRITSHRNESALHLLIENLMKGLVDKSRKIEALDRLADNLLSAGCPVNLVNEEGYSALRLAVDRSASPRLIQSLIKHGASVNGVTYRDDHTLLSSWNRSNVGMLNALVAAGADIKVQDRYGRSPIFFAADEEGLQALIDLGADVNHRDNNGQSVALALLRQHTNIGTDPWKRVACLISAGADLVTPDYTGESALMILSRLKSADAKRTVALIGAMKAKSALQSAAISARLSKTGRDLSNT